MPGLAHLVHLLEEDVREAVDEREPDVRVVAPGVAVLVLLAASDRQHIRRIEELRRSVLGSEPPA